MQTRRGKWSLVALGTMGLLIHLAEAAPRDAGPPPDADFLEFLGSWNTADDKWVDPFQEDDSPVLETSEPASPSASRDIQDRSRTKQLDQEPSTSENQPASQRPRRDVTP
jgi:hypothetical protein